MYIFHEVEQRTNICLQDLHRHRQSGAEGGGRRGEGVAPGGGRREEGGGLPHHHHSIIDPV